MFSRVENASSLLKVNYLVGSKLWIFILLKVIVFVTYTYTVRTEYAVG